MTSIVIPAHNEAATIESCLSVLLHDACEKEFEIIVACNGCSDKTVAIAESVANRRTGHSKIDVLDLAEASKVVALNAGIAVAVRPNIIFLDADVMLSTRAARQVASALNQDGVLAASTTLAVDSRASSWVSRSYHRYWSLVPSVARGLAGRGVYGLNKEGLSRLKEFPPIVADDRYVDLLFSHDERRIVESVSTVASALNARDLIRRKERVFAGNNQLLDYQRPDSEPLKPWPYVVLASPARIVDLPAYLIVNLAAKVRARRWHQAQRISWNPEVPGR